MKHWLRMLFLLAGLLARLPGQAQAPGRSVLDSLRRLLATAAPDTNRVKLLNDLANTYRSSRPDTAYRLGQQSYQLAQRLGYLAGQAQASNVMGNALSQLGDYPKAIRFLQQYLALGQAMHNLVFEAKAQNNIAVVYLDQKAYDQALYHQRASLRLFERAQVGRPPDSLLATINYCNLGEVYSNMGQTDSAERYLARALPLTRNKQALSVLPNILYVLGDIRKQQHNAAGALSFYHRALHAPGLANDSATKSLIYLRLANLHRAEGARDSSLVYARQALRSSQTSDFLTGVLPASQLLAQLYEGHDDTQALRYHKVAVAAKDSLFSQQKVRQLLTISFEEQQRQQELNAARAAYQDRLRLYGLGGVVGVVALVAGLLWRTTRRQRRTNALLSHQQAELQQQRTKAEAAYQALQATQTQLIQREKMASLGELIAGIAHEIQNPLNFVNNFSEVSAEMLDDLAAEQQQPTRDEAAEQELLTDLKANLLKINHHGRRADAIVRGMLAHSRVATGTKQPTKLNLLTEEYLRLAYQDLRAKHKGFACELLTDFDPRVGTLAVVPQDIGRVLINIVNNAFYATQQRWQQAAGTGYQPQVRVQTRRTEQAIEIQVWDNGLGMPEAVREKVFQPFFTTKPTGQGTGLGLSLSYDIVTQGHGGTLQVDSVEGEHTAFTLQLPLPVEQPAMVLST